MKAGPVYVHVPVEYVADMRAVVIVEFWAMMAGALPYGWQRRWGVPHPTHRGCWCVAEPDGYDWGDISLRDAWAAEYAARPRIEITTRTNGKA